MRMRITASKKITRNYLKSYCNFSVLNSDFFPSPLHLFGMKTREEKITNEVHQGYRSKPP
jgi:hypothetical protein